MIGFAVATVLLHACGGGGGDSAGTGPAEPFTFTRIADTTSAAPGSGAGTLTFFQASSISQSGDITAFKAFYAGGHGIFTGSGGALTTVAKTGDAVPGSSTFTFGFVGEPSQGGSTTAFSASWSESANSGQGAC